MTILDTTARVAVAVALFDAVTTLSLAPATKQLFPKPDLALTSSCAKDGIGVFRMLDDGHDGLQQVARPGCAARAARSDIAQQRQRRYARRLPRHLRW